MNKIVTLSSNLLYLFSCLLGLPNIMNVYTRNKAGHVAFSNAPPVVADSSAPTEGTISCLDYIQVFIHIWTKIKMRDGSLSSEASLGKEVHW